MAGDGRLLIDKHPVAGRPDEQTRAVHEERKDNRIGETRIVGCPALALIG